MYLSSIYSTSSSLIVASVSLTTDLIVKNCSLSFILITSLYFKDENSVPFPYILLFSTLTILPFPSFLWSMDLSVGMKLVN